ncbi:element excision factor XisI family protein [Leptolyngbya sp. GGD]|uniref:element excision factor XisI family protein n=1 Tax=Leptolyngbya sp. GGD TaxID=2997907 RepID=UPI00227A6EE9|nr:element excision factor XisI family protein [Leptolyngbya sp. GGD]MCY6494557.1 element excision factor XisI family protein [Leptolyngbya sp. GGD]
MNESKDLNEPEEKDLLTTHRDAVKEVILHQAELMPVLRTIKFEPHFDEAIDHYTLVKTGWKKGRQIRDLIISIRLRGEGIHIESVRKGIEKDLVKLGVLRDYIYVSKNPNPFLRGFDTVARTYIDSFNSIHSALSSEIDLSSKTGRRQLFGVFCFFLLAIGLLLVMTPRISLFLYSYDFSLAGIITSIGGILGLIAWAILDNIPDSLTSIVQANYQDAEQRAKENPDKVKPAWDIANSTLSAYFNRNLKQVDWIFRLSVAVMLLGLGLVGVGIALAYQKPENITVAIVGGIAGVITQFIGATFLFIYKSTISQANKYTETLERINSVGMAMQILDGISEQERVDSLEKLVSAKIEIAKLLLAKSQGTQVNGETEDKEKQT